MTFSVWQGFLAIVMLLTIVVLLQQGEAPLDATKRTSQTGDSDLSMKQTYTRQFDKDGALRYTLTTTKSVWHAQKSSANFQNPKLAIFEPNEKVPFWTAEANQGQVIAQSAKTPQPKAKASNPQKKAPDLSLFGLNADDLFADDSVEEITQVILQGDVVLVQDHNPYFKLNSEALTIMPLEKRVTGQGVVALQFNSNTATGYGLEADLTASHYSLGSHERVRVHSIYTFDL